MMCQRYVGAIARLVVMLGSAFGTAMGLCDCGYIVEGANEDRGRWLFTDMLESNFVKIENVSQVADWIPQQFTVSATDGRGKYGKVFKPDNILAVLNESNKTHELVANDAGIKLLVGSKVENDGVPVAEMDTLRQDLHWGSYRAGMKLTGVNGTCSAFFWYFNDTQEIDMEFLSREFDRDSHVYPVNLVIQSKASRQAGYDAQATGTFSRVNLTFDPTAGFHEYRFDYMPGQVQFYADSELLTEMKGPSIPSSSGHLILQHWSNGNPEWSGGPPVRDAWLTVSYVKAYFNSSQVAGQVDWRKRCQNDREQVCTVANVTATNASTGGHFWSDATPRRHDDNNAATGTKGDDGNSGASLFASTPSVAMTAALASAVLWVRTVVVL